MNFTFQLRKRPVSKNYRFKTDSYGMSHTYTTTAVDIWRPNGRIQSCIVSLWNTRPEIFWSFCLLLASEFSEQPRQILASRTGQSGSGILKMTQGRKQCVVFSTNVWLLPLCNDRQIDKTPLKEWKGLSRTSLKDGLSPATTIRESARLNPRSIGRQISRVVALY